MKKKLLCVLMGAIVVTSAIATNVLASSDPKTEITTVVYEKDSINEIETKDFANVSYDNLLDNEETKENITITVYPKTSDNLENEPSDTIDILRDSSLARGDSKPTSYHDLTVSDYYYDIPNLVSSTYTNYYFNASYQNEISFQTINLDTAGKKLDIILYEVNGGSVASWTGVPSSIEGVGFNGLSTSKHYYFQIKADIFTKVKGSGKIHHHYK